MCQNTEAKSNKTFPWQLCLLGGLLTSGLFLPSPTFAQPPQNPSTQHSMIDVPPLQPMPGIWIDWRKRLIHAQGKSTIPSEGPDSQRRLHAMRAARTDALRKLAAVIHGMHIDRSVRIDNYLQRHQEDRIKVQGLVQGAHEYHPARFVAPNQMEVHLVIPLSAVESQLELSQPLPRQ